MKHPLRRAAALVAAPTLTVAALAATPAPAHAAESPAPAATAAASWLSTQLTDGDVLGQGAPFGATLDLAQGLIATGASPSLLATLSDGIDAGVDAYATTPAAAAKAAWFYAAADETVPADLVTDVEEAVDPSGRFGTDAANQALAVLALEGAGSAEAEMAGVYLAGMQCEDGSFAYNEDCSFGGTVFDTATALLALDAIEDPLPGPAAAIPTATAYVADQQLAGGAFGAPNANDPGIAGWALGEVGRTDLAAAAATWIAARQIVSLPGCAARVGHGALMWTDADFAEGLTESNLASTVYSSAQALGALAHLPASAPAMSAPKGYVKAGSTVTVKVTGLRAGEAACLSGAGSSATLAGPGSLSVKLPAATREHTLTLFTLGTPVTTTVEALGAKKLKLDRSKKVKKGKKQTVKVTGLAAGEKVTVRVDGKRVDAGKATAAGVVKSVFKVTGKPGKRTVKVVGQFGNRTGTTTFKVVR